MAGFLNHLKQTHEGKQENSAWKIVKVSLIVLLVAIILGLFIYERYFYQEPDYSQGQRIEELNFSKGTDISKETFTRNGVEYRYNEYLSNFLFMGLDKSEFTKTEKGKADAGQTDALYILSMNRLTGKTNLISIPRDCMTYITEYTSGSKIPLLLWDHLSTQYGYGDGKHESCNLTKNAVSAMLYHLPIQGYCAIALDSLAVIAEASGDIAVEIPNDSLAFRDDDYQLGSQVTITAENIEFFLRSRDINTDNSAMLRLDRQRVFLKAYLEQAKQRYEGDPEFVADLYAQLKPHMVTNMTTDQFVRLLEGSAYGKGVDEWIVPGKGVATDTYDEFHVNDAELLDMLIDAVCIPVGK